VTGTLRALLRSAAGHREVRTGARSDPFRILGLEPRADLTDGEVHAAWRRIASATHPDREDGGNPPQFAEAAAAYTALRTRSGRGETLADLRATPPPGARVGRRRRATATSPGREAAAGAPRGSTSRRLAGLARRVTCGRPVRLTLRTIIAAAAAVGAVLAAGPHPAAPALVTGIVTWLVVTARHDLAPANGPERTQADDGHRDAGPR
jgi:curved DNA-binding protein CbpA